MLNARAYGLCLTRPLHTGHTVWRKRILRYFWPRGRLFCWLFFCHYKYVSLSACVLDGPSPESRLPCAPNPRCPLPKFSSFLFLFCRKCVVVVVFAVITRLKWNSWQFRTRRMEYESVGGAATLTQIEPEYTRSSPLLWFSGARDSWNSKWSEFEIRSPTCNTHALGYAMNHAAMRPSTIVVYLLLHMRLLFMGGNANLKWISCEAAALHPTDCCC